MEQFSENLRYVFNRMWRMGYGTVRGLHFRDGEPVLDPPFDVVRTVRLPRLKSTSPTDNRVPLSDKT